MPDFTNKNFAAGMDQHSAISAIKPGYSERITNMDVNASGYISTRSGYEGYYGYVPIRVTEIEHDGTTIKFKVPSFINLLNTSTTPIVAYGKLGSPSSAGSGDFTTTAAATYYDSFSLSSEITLSSGANTYTLTAADHGLSTKYIFAGLARADATGDRSNTTLIPDDVTITASSYQLDVDYTNASTESGYLFYSDKSASSGVTYIESVAGVTTKTITAATHGLRNFFIIAKAYQDDTTTITEVIPKEVQISSAGAVTMDFDTSFTGDIVLTSVAATNVASTTATGTGTQTVTVSSPGSAFNFISVYVYDGADYTQIIPDDIAYDATTDQIDIDVTLAAAAETIEIYYENASIIGNILEVTDSSATSESYTDTSPQITIWGIAHDGLYTSGTRGGHVNHIDTYRSSGDERAVCGLGGNLFAARTRAEVGTTYLMPEFQFRARGRVASDTVVAPLFQTAATSRTRGDVVDASISSDNYATITGASNTADTYTSFTFEFTSKTGNIADGIDANSDYLTVTNMPYSQLNGTFLIESIVSEDSTSAVVRVYNTSAQTRFDCSGAKGMGGVFTEKLTLNSQPSFNPGDDFAWSGMTSSLSPEVVVAESSSIYINGITGEYTVSGGSRVGASRSSYVIPCESIASTATVDEVVVGDMLTVDGYTRKVRVVSINTNADESVSVTISSGTATVTTSGAHNFKVGQKVMICGDGVETANTLNGVQTITSIPSTTTFTFTTSASGSATVRLVGKTIEVDENITLSDTGTATSGFEVVGRWIPIEVPSDDEGYSEVADYVVHHFDANNYNAQPYLKSTIIQDTMFLTNGDDSVYKFDGTNLYRAGLPRWQPWVFTQVDTTTASITIDNTTATYDSVNGRLFKFTSTKTDAGTFKVGDRVEDAQDNEQYIIVSFDTDTGIIEVDKPITGSSGTKTLTRVSVYSCYFRLNAIDANNNIVASAATSSQDCIVNLGSSGQIKHRLVGLPAFDNYDYDRLEVQYYRTRADEALPFHLIQTVPLQFDYGDSYIDITDGTPDDVLTGIISDDPVTALIPGGELPTTIGEPLRAKYVTTVDNRLIYANLTGYPKWDLTFLKTQDAAQITSADLHQYRILFRKDISDTTTTSNFNARQGYEFIDKASASPVKLLGANFDFVDGDVTVGTDSIAETGHGLLTGHKVQLSTTGTLPTGLATSTDYYIIRVDADNIKFASSVANAVAGTPVTITAASGGGTHTVEVQSNIATTATTAVVTSVSHGLAVADWVYLYHDAEGTNNSLTFAGWYQLSAVDTHTFTFELNHGQGTSGGTTSDVDYFITATLPADVPVLLGTDGNYNTQNGNTSSTYENHATLRLSNAINASMRAVNPAAILATYTLSSAQPWLAAYAGEDYGNGQIVIYQPKVESTTAEILLDSYAGTENYQIFVHGLLRDSGDEQISSRTSLYPSRVGQSYENFAEIFDNLDAPETSSDSARDINAADGEAITSIISFFGESTFGGAQLNAITVVFKESSIYVYEPATKQYQKIDSRGLGCTAPRSVAATRNGIVFANQSGIYRLNRNLTISYMGKYVEKIWKDEVSLSNLSEACGHQYRFGRKYKLSVPVSSTYNNQVLVYDHDTEGQDHGGWVEYTNHPATGWANLDDEAFFSTTNGQVYKIRKDGDMSDYRDDASAISIMFKSKPEDFGYPGVRKIVRHAEVELDPATDLTALSISSRTNLNQDFSATTTLTTSADDYLLARISASPRKGNFAQIQITHSTLDEEVIIAGIHYNIIGLSEQGLKEAINYS